MSDTTHAPCIGCGRHHTRCACTINECRARIGLLPRPGLSVTMAQWLDRASDAAPGEPSTPS